MDNRNVASQSVCSPAMIHSTANKSINVLDQVMDNLTIYDYKSILFLLMDFMEPREYLHIVNKNIDDLKCKFRDIYYELPHKNEILIEILGTMKKFRLLKILYSCNHVFKSESDSFTQISNVWKTLFNVCEQLSDSQVMHLKEKLLPDTTTVITCAEQLFCEALLAHVFEKDNISSLKDIFRNFNSDCFYIISSYEGSSKLRFYPMKRPTKKSPCGYAIILNHDRFCDSNDNSVILTERIHSQKDADSLKKLWDNFGFKTSIHQNLSSEEVDELFNELAQLDHSSYNAFVVCILSHGDQGVFFTHDCERISIKWLINIMANSCPTLLSKPKLFFVEACQGIKVQEGIYKSEKEPINIHPHNVDLTYKKVGMDTPEYTDVLIAYSTIEGYTSFTPSGENSWFINELVHVMEKYGEELTMTNVLTKVADLVSRKKGILDDENGHFTNCKQTVLTNSTLRQEIKLKKRMV